jgi:hypothetical protein
MWRCSFWLRRPSSRPFLPTRPSAFSSTLSPVSHARFTRPSQTTTTTQIEEEEEKVKGEKEKEVEEEGEVA